MGVYPHLRSKDRSTSIPPFRHPDDSPVRDLSVWLRRARQKLPSTSVKYSDSAGRLDVPSQSAANRQGCACNEDRQGGGSRCLAVVVVLDAVDTSICWI